MQVNKLLIFLFSFQIVGGQMASAQTVTITGAAKVKTGSTVTYYVSDVNQASCKGYYWSVSGGTLNNTNGTTSTSMSITWSSTVVSNASVSVSDACDFGSNLNVTLVPPLSSATISPGSQTIACNASPALSVSSGGGDGTYTYQWESSANGTSYSPVSGAINSTYSPPGLTSDTYFHVIVQSFGYSLTSAATKITVTVPALSGGTISNPIQYSTYLAPVSLICSPASGGVCNGGAYLYQWQYSSNGTSGWADLSGFISQNYSTSTSTITNTTYYRRQTSSNGQTAYSDVAKIIPPLYGGIISSSAAVITSGGNISLSGGSASGGSGSYAYQYQSSTDEQNWSNCSATVSNISATTYFRRQVTSGTDIAYSNIVRVKIKDATPTTIAPNTTTSPDAGTATSITMPGYGTMDANDMNYIKTRTFTKAGVTDLATANSITDDNAVHQTTEYFDGLGRSIQSVAMQATPQGKDMIATTFYDPFGRVAQQYLPYTDGGTSGAFRTNAATQQPAFYNSQFNNTEGYYYSNTIYEPSPLNRVLKTTAPGNSWTGHGAGVSQLTRTNDIYDAVRIWNIGYNEDDLPTSTAVYNPGTLYVVETTDENGNEVVEYKDLEGHVILKKVEQADALQPGYDGWLCTYYVYNDLDELCFVIPPRAVEYLLNNNWTVTVALRDNLCFSYLYDGRKRLIVKTVPNAGKSQMVYNKRDLVVGGWDASQRASFLCTYMKYDVLNRLTGVGVCGGTNLTRAAYQALADADLYYPADGIPGTYLKTQTFYDDYSWVTGAIVSSYGISASMKTNVYNGFTTSYNVSPDFAVAPTASNMTRGMVTGTITESIATTMEGGQPFYRANFYDDRGRVIQTQSNNISAPGAVDYSTVQYDFSGKPLNTYLQENKQGTTPLTTGILTHNTYDAQGRLLNISKTINGGTAKTTATYAYNELGQLQNKNIGTLNGSPLDNLAYAYNIRGWMSSINKAYLNANTSSSAPSAGNYFGMELDYDFGFNQNQLNGNIAGAKWKSAGDQYARAFGYDYDNVNRILKADFTQTQTGSSYAQDSKVNFSVSGISYDANGNIMGLQRNGLLIGSSAPIDNLTYKYSSNSTYTNQLSSVSDAVTVNNHLGDFYDANTADNDYTYDLNGNLTSDKNKAISSITYNYLNLPEVITITGKGTITYLYDAEGNKLKKVTQENNATVPYNNVDNTTNITTTTTYIGGFVYESKAYSNAVLSPLQYTDVLQFVSHEEGRIRPELIVASTGYVPSNINWVYDYFEKDHLGNVRMVLTEEQKIDHYPTATLEGSGAGSPLANEENYYDINESFVVNKPTTTNPSNLLDYVNDNGTNNPNTFGDKNAVSQKMYQLNANTNRTGMSKILQVMAGDKIDILAKSYYQYNSGGVTNATLNAGDIISAFLAVTGGGNAAAAHGATSTLLNSNSNLVVPLDGFSNNNPINSNNEVKAGINYVILDAQFNYVTGGFDPVDDNASGGLKNHFIQNITIPKNGYIYIYCSNESNIDVFFDNLEVVDTRGPILEETHYYPFGLTMAGISSKAFGGVENKYKYNKGSELQNKEFSDGSGLELYATNLRSLDPQLGRWWQTDSKPDYAQSLYSAMNNNPILYNDPLGDTTINGQKYEFTNPNHPQVLAEVKITAKSNKESNNISGIGLGALGFAVTYGDAKMFNNKSWFNLKAGRSYSQKYFGNQYQSAEEINAAKGLSKNVSRGFKYFGYGLGLYNAINIQNDKAFSGKQKAIEKTSNAISTFAPFPYGASWGIGWEAGRTITQIPWYRQNVRPLIQDLLEVPRDEVPKSSSEFDKYFQ